MASIGIAVKPVRRSQSNFAEGERPSVPARVLTWIIMIAAVIYFLLPVVWLFIASTKSATDLYSSPGFAFSHWNFFANIESLSTYNGGIFWRWMLNSLIYSGLGSVLTTLISAWCGYALAIYEFRGRRILMGALLASLLVPSTVLAEPTFVLLVQLGLNNNYLGVLLPTLVYPFGVMLGFITARSAVPVQIIEAARLDGASEFRIFFTVAWRMMSTGLTTVLLFAFIASWNNFLLPLLVLNDQSLFPVTLGLTGWSQSSSSIAHLGTLTVVGAFVSIVPLIIVFVSLQRFWRSGLAAGGVRF